MLRIRSFCNYKTWPGAGVEKQHCSQRLFVVRLSVIFKGCSLFVIVRIFSKKDCLLFVFFQKMLFVFKKTVVLSFFSIFQKRLFVVCHSCYFSEKGCSLFVDPWSGVANAYKVTRRQFFHPKFDKMETSI